MDELKFNSLELRTIGDDKVNSVSLRELYLDLGYSEPNFTTWCKKNLLADFIENQDYVQLFIEKKLNETETESRGGNNKAKEYLITTDTAKHLALISRTDKGKSIRQYFINIEKIAKIEIGQEKLNLELKKLESDVEMAKLAVDEKKVQMVQLLNSMGANIDPIAMLKSGEFKRTLPKDLGEVLSEVATEVRHDVRAYSATHLLKKFDIQVRTPDWNNYLIEIDIVTIYKHKGKLCKKFIDRTNYYGYNKFASSKTELPYQILYYEDKFLDLVQLLRIEGYID